MAAPPPRMEERRIRALQELHSMVLRWFLKVV
jgi:hypothetical protein